MDRSMDNPGARDLEAELKRERLCRKNAEDVSRACTIVAAVCAFGAALVFVLGLWDAWDQANLASAAVHARDDARAALVQERLLNDGLMTASSDCEEGREFWQAEAAERHIMLETAQGQSSEALQLAREAIRQRNQARRERDEVQWYLERMTGYAWGALGQRDELRAQLAACEARTEAP